MTLEVDWGWGWGEWERGLFCVKHYPDLSVGCQYRSIFNYVKKVRLSPTFYVKVTCRQSVKRTYKLQQIINNEKKQIKI